MDAEQKTTESNTDPVPPEPTQDAPVTVESHTSRSPAERKEDEEEEEEEEEEDKIVERSHNSRFHKRNKRFPKQIEGVDSAFVAIEPKSGKEVIWNECLLSEKKTEKEQYRYLSIIKKLKRNSHPFLARFLDAWISKSETGQRKLVFITERLDECSLKQFLCNSPINSRSWKRHVGQILSVLMFLHRLGITHGNLTKETIYYQNSGNLRVGPFALGRCLDQKSQSFDVYSLGIVALEIAVWKPTAFSATLTQTELVQEMLARLEDESKRNFVEMCLDPNPPAGDRIKRLINHPAVTEVPVLKLLSAKVIVSTMRSGISEDGTTAEQTGFAQLLKEYLSHYEDDAVIVEVRFPHDKITNSRSWKDFRSNFTLTPKFLDDVKNGFYPLFGCRWAAYHEEEEESLTMGHTNGGLMGISSSASLAGRGGELNTALSSQVHSSACSTVPSACVSRKHSSTIKTGESMGGAPALTEDAEGLDEAHQAASGRSFSLVDPSGSRPPMMSHPGRQSDTNLAHHPPLFQQAGRSVSRDDPSSLVSVSSAVGPAAEFTQQSTVASQVDLGEASAASPADLPHSASGFVEPSGKAASADQTRRETLEKLRPSTDDVHLQEQVNATQPVSEEHGHERVDFLIGTGLDPEPIPIPAAPKSSASGPPYFDASAAATQDQASSTGVPVEPTSGQAKEDEDDDKDEEEVEEEEDEDNDEEEDDDEDEEKDLGEVADRFEPQTIHVAAPEHAPAHPALFTHCQYFYVGAGRWQVYVQMWFVEERLKREAYVQVFDYEWHDYDRVADLFEASRCLNPVDRPSLLRLLSLARHNCALIDGELQFPGPLNSRPLHFDAFELHEKLAILRLHQQAREKMHLRGAELAQEHNGVAFPGGTETSNSHEQSVSISGLDTELPSSVPTEKDSTAVQSEPPEMEANRTAPDEVAAACADHAAQLQEQQRGSQPPCRPLSPPRSAVMTEADLSKDSAGLHTRSDLLGGPTLFVDVGTLAPRNSYCALCDTHDYLHRVDLPAYLISPCYHCREALAREAKISPELLLDLHLQHNIPWPAFLQARFGIPTDGRSLEELIAYDCRWRSRQPCRCLVSYGCPILPPCVEFPWLATTTSWNGPAAVTQTSQSQTGAVPPETEKKEASPLVVNTTDAAPSSGPSETKQRAADSKGNSPPQTMVAGHATEIAQSSATSSNSTSHSRTPLLPCAARHSRGAPTTCCHGIQFPRLGIPTGAPIQPTPQAPTVAETPPAITTGHSSSGGAGSTAACPAVVPQHNGALSS